MILFSARFIENDPPDDEDDRDDISDDTDDMSDDILDETDDPYDGIGPTKPCWACFNFFPICFDLNFSMLSLNHCIADFNSVKRKQHLSLLDIIPWAENVLNVTNQKKFLSGFC